ncbi:GEVED domain-containing protein, partial [Hymenobacter daeguensis]
ATLTGLTALTGYQFYVTQNCGGANGNSALSNAGAFTTNPNPAANDECATAVPLPIGTSCTTPLNGTVFGATQSLAPTANCGGTVANDVWYSFTATSTALQLTTGAQFFGYYDVRSGTCAATTSVACGTLGTTAAPLQGLIAGLTVGQVYFVRIYSTAATTAAASNFTLCLTPLQNYCNTGLGGVCGGNDITTVSITGTTLNATGLTCTTTAGQAYTTYPATGANTATLQSGVPYQLSVTLGATSIASVWIDYNHNLIFEASEWTQLTTNAATTPTLATLNIPTTAVQGPTGMRIRSRANGNSNGAGDACTNFGSGETKDFTITIGPPVACPTASNVAVTAVTPTSASLTFTSSASAVSYTLTLTPQNGTPSTRTVTAAPVSLSPLLPGTTYTVSLVSNCAGSTTSPAVILTFATPPTPPANDDCAGAINVPVQFVTCTTQVSADNTAATSTTGAPAPTCANYNGNDIWFKVTVPVTGSVTVQTVAPTGGSNVTDTGLSVYSGTCAALTQLDCNDDANGSLYSQLVFAGRTPGEVLYIRVWSYGNNTAGPIAVCVTSPSNCAPPTGPSVGTTTNTSAVLSWVAPTGGSAGNTYEVEYGPQGFNQGSGTFITGLTATTTTIASLIPATAYCFYVRQNCGTTNGSSAWAGPTCFTTPLTAPTNDEPCGAIGLGSGTRTGTNLGATTSTQNGITFPVCSPSSQPKDVWFAFTATAATASFALTGAPAGMVRVYASPSCSAGPFTLV